MVYELKAYAYTAISLTVGLLCFRFCAQRSLNRDLGRRLLPLMLAAQAAAFLSPNVVIYNVLVGVFFAACCVNRRAIAPLYLFLLVTLPPAGKIIVAAGTYFMMYDVTISLGLVALIMALIRTKDSRSQSHLIDVPVLIMFALFVLANSRSTSITNGMRTGLEQAGTILLPYFVIRKSVRSFDDLRDAFYGLVAGVSALSTLAIYESIHTWPLYRVVSDHYGIVLSGGESVKLRGGLLRSPGPYPEPTSFGLCLAIGLIAAIGCPQLFSSRMRRAAIIALVVIGVLAPQSRGAWIGIVVGAALLSIYERRYADLLKKSIGAALAALAIFVAAESNSRIASAVGLNAEGQGTVEYRSNLLERGIETVMLNPAFGSTTDDVRYAMRDMTQGEGIIDFVNTYLYVALISGLIGLMVFLTVLLWPTLMLWAAREEVRRRERNGFRLKLASLVFATLVASIIMIAFTSMIGRTTIILVIYIAFASTVIDYKRVGSRRAGLRSEDALGKSAALHRA